MGGGSNSYFGSNRTLEEAEKTFKTAVEEVQQIITERESRTFNLFISHAWLYNADYYRLLNLLNRDPYFNYKNYSVPEHDPLETKTDKELEEALHSQIGPTHIVLIISGMYVNYREWIQKEIDIALELNKPIIGLKPRGAQRTPKAIQNIALEIVNWTTKSIVDAIKSHAL